MDAVKKYLFSAYGISIDYLADWRIYVDPKMGFDQTHGLVRIEDFKPKKGAAVSLSINWESTDYQGDDFEENFLNNIDGEFQKQFKKGSRYEIKEKEIITNNGQRHFFTRVDFQGSQSIFQKKDDPMVSMMQIGLHDKANERIIVASILTRPEIMVENEELYRELLISIRTL